VARFFSNRREYRTILDMHEPNSLRLRKRRACEARAAGSGGHEGFRSASDYRPDEDDQDMDDISADEDSPQQSDDVPESPHPHQPSRVNTDEDDSSSDSDDTADDAISSAPPDAPRVDPPFLFNYRGRLDEEKQGGQPRDDEEKGVSPKVPKEYAWSRPGVQKSLRDNLASLSALDLEKDCCHLEFCLSEDGNKRATHRCPQCGPLCEWCAHNHPSLYLFHSPKEWNAHIGQLQDVQPRVQPNFKHLQSNLNVTVTLIGLLGVALVTVEHEPGNLVGELVSRGYWPNTSTEQCRTAFSIALFRFIEGLGSSMASILKALAAAHSIELPAGLENTIQDSYRHWREARNNVETLSTVMELPQGCPGCHER
jgi:hypothetical protein